MQVALQKLGYKAYHMIEGYRTKAMKYWLEALRAKYANEGVPYQRVEFDKLLGDYSVRGSSTEIFSPLLECHCSWVLAAKGLCRPPPIFLVTCSSTSFWPLTPMPKSF